MNIPQIGMPPSMMLFMSDTAYNVSPNHEREQELIKRYLITQHFDLEYENILAYVPLMSPNALKSILAYIRDNVCEDKKDLYAGVPPPTNGELSLVFAIEGINNLN